MGQPAMSAQASALLPLVYADLCSLARARLSRYGPASGLTPSELVHEAYLRVAADGSATFDGRRHFFFAVARAIHDILVEGARRRASLKHGGSYVVVSGLDEVPASEPLEELLELDLALQKLERKSAESAQVVLLGHFGGLTQPQIAAALGLSLATVERRWRASRAWLRRELSPSAEPDRRRPGEAPRAGADDLEAAAAAPQTD